MRLMTSPPPTPELVTLLVDIINTLTNLINSLTSLIGTPAFDVLVAWVLEGIAFGEQLTSYILDVVC